jgi:biopolymer transport protein ExbD
MRRREADMPDMTSMIDVVFLMVIFFVITAAVQVERREDIILEHAPHGDCTPHGKPLEIDIDRTGAAYIAFASLTETSQSGLSPTAHVPNGPWLLAHGKHPIGARTESLSPSRFWVVSLSP